MESGIEVRGLTKRFGSRIAVDDLSLSIPQGDFFGLLGVNGAGKTTTIRMMTGLLRPDSGEITILGRDALHQREEVRPLINSSMQETAVAPNLTAEENLALIAGIYSLPDAHSAIERRIAQFGLEEYRSTLARNLSGGWQRRLSIAMALITEPAILFLDEPTLGLDVLARRSLHRILLGLRGQTTLVLTTHDLDEAAALCNTIGVMIRGRLCACGTPAELTAMMHADTFEDAFAALAEKEGEA